MRHSLLVPAAVCILLAGCVPQKIVSLPSVFFASSSSSSLAGTGSLASVAPPTEFPVEESSSLSAGTGALAERLIERGILEIGKADAPWALTVFGNPSCDYCREFTLDMLPALGERFVRPGSLRIQIVTVPLKKYPGSGNDTAALICAAALGRGTDMTTALANTKSHDRTALLTVGKKLGLPAKDFAACFDARETKRLLAQQQDFVTQQNVTLIPAFLLSPAAPGTAGSGGTLHTERQTGLPSLMDLSGWIQDVLRR